MPKLTNYFTYHFLVDALAKSKEYCCIWRTEVFIKRDVDHLIIQSESVSVTNSLWFIGIICK